MPRGKTAKSLVLIDACYAILEQIQPATVRAVCYRLFVQGLLESMAKKCTNSVSTQLVYARKNGLVLWAWVVDETREAERPGTWTDPTPFIPAVMRSYRRDRWAQQPRRVEVWSEKGTVRGTLAPVLHEYGVTFRVMHGHTSWTCVHEVAYESREDPRPLTVFYVGDDDPSGLHMSVVDLPKRLGELEAHVAVERLAILQADADAQQLPSFSAHTKSKDTRYPWFLRNYGDTCWELDAMNPVDLRAAVESAITTCILWEPWQRCDRVEWAERASLEQILGNWPTAISRLVPYHAGSDG